MFRNQYDTDVTVWSPEGRLLQVRTRDNGIARRKTLMLPANVFVDLVAFLMQS